MKSVLNDLFPVESRTRRRKSLVSESRERILTSPAHISPLNCLGKRPEQVYCPYCKQTTKTRVVQSDSRTTKRVNALVWIGLADPFAISSYDLFQNVDHFCMSCNGHLARKPYRGQVQAIPEDSVLELQSSTHHKSAVLPENPSRVLDLDSNGDRQSIVQSEADKQATLRSQSPHEQSRILHPAERDWDVYQPSLLSDDQSVVTTEQPLEAREFLCGPYQTSTELLEVPLLSPPELRNLTQSSSNQFNR